jgi:anti-sigma factor RsiW
VNVALADHLDGDLAPAVRLRLEDHLVRCVRCLTYLHGYRTTVRLIHASARTAVTAPLPEALVRTLLASRGGDA